MNSNMLVDGGGDQPPKPPDPKVKSVPHPDDYAQGGFPQGLVNDIMNVDGLHTHGNV